jgi:hypothetical protein
MKTHYYSKGATKLACNTSARRAATLACTSDRATFDRARASGHACEKCCAGVEKMDRIAAKYAARAQAKAPRVPVVLPENAGVSAGLLF